MRLYLDLSKSLDLMKAAGAPPTGGGAGGASKLPNTPGAAVGGSGPELVECPLGDGKHEMGSTKQKEHFEQFQRQQQTGQKPGDESTGEATEKPGVPPGATNLGSVGAVEQPKPPAAAENDTERHFPGGLANRTDRPSSGAHGAAYDYYRDAAMAQGTPEADEHLQNARNAMDVLPGDKHADMVRRLKNAGMHKEAAYQEGQMNEHKAAMSAMEPAKGKKAKGKKAADEAVNKVKAEHAAANASKKPVPTGSTSEKVGSAIAASDQQEADAQVARLKGQVKQGPSSINQPPVGKEEVPQPSVKRLPPPLHAGEGEAGVTPVQTGEFHTEAVDPSQEQPQGHSDFSAQAFQQDPHGSKTRSMFQGATDEPSVGQFQRPELASSGLKGHVAGAVTTRPGMEQQEFANPMSASESQIPVNSQPMDHYRLSQVARESGDEEGAKFQEGMARKRTEGLGSEDHKELANQLHAAGMHEQAKYHEGIHQGATEGQKEVSPEKAQAAEAEHQGKMRDVHHEARSKAEKDLADAKDKHKKLQDKAEELKEKNKQALKDYEEKKAVHAMGKEMGNKSAAPKKPKLEKEPKVPEKPEISEPSNSHERLQHDTHTSRAKRVADLAESHLANNKDLSSGDRKRLERAHEMAVYHSNIGYTPTAQHKKELADAENAVSGMGIKQTHQEMQAEADKKNTEVAAKKAEKDRAATEKQQAKQQKLDEKKQTQQQKMDAQAQADQPQPPQTDLDHARVADHQSKAKKLRESLQQHMTQNPNMSPEDKNKASMILSELGKHEQLDMVPGKDHVAELKELQQLAGEHAQLPKDGEGGVGGTGGVTPTDVGGNYAMNMIHQGRALGHGLGASATNPHGAGGQLGSQVINYGVSGVAHAGHRLLHDSHQQEREAQQDQAKGKV